MGGFGESWRLRGSPLPDSLAFELREQIIRGSILPGQPLPSERSLASRAGVSRTTVAAAIDILEAGGWCERRTRARAVAHLPELDSQSIGPTMNHKDIVDLVAARVAAPAALLECAIDRAGRRLRQHLLTDGRCPGGLGDLRAGIADRLTRDGLATTPEQVIVTNGAMGALDAVLQCTKGVIVAEDPTYHVALELMSGRRRRIVGWNRGPQWDAPALFDIVRRERPEVAYLVPDFHNPTGALATNEERESIRALGGSVPFVVIDETLRDLDLSSSNQLHSLPQHLAEAIPTAITIGGLSKNVWSGLRVGWLRAPVRVQREMLSRYTDVQPCPVFEQLIGYELLADLDDIMRARNRRLRAQRDLLVRELRSGGIDATTPAGGLVLWLDLAAPIADQVSRRLADDHHLAVGTGRRFGVNNRYLAHIRMPFTHDENTLTSAARRIVDVVRDVRSTRTGATGTSAL